MLNRLANEDTKSRSMLALCIHFEFLKRMFHLLSIGTSLTAYAAFSRV